MIILYFVSKDVFFLFDSCTELEHFGVYYENVIYYLSTNPDTDVVKHFLQGIITKEYQKRSINSVSV